MADSTLRAPLTIAMHECDNVAIVANDGGLPAGTTFASGLTLVDKVPQGHKVALVDLAAGDPVLRYNVVIGRAARAIPAGSWVHERLLEMPAVRPLEGLPIARSIRRAARSRPYLRGLRQRLRVAAAQHPCDHTTCSASPACSSSPSSGSGQGGRRSP